MERNLTEGSVFKNIIFFSIPFLISSFLQTLYGLADLFIIGKFCQVEATTAVSIGSQVMHMLTVMIVGLAMGSTVLIGRAVGSKDKRLRNKAIGNTATIFLLVSVLLMGMLLLFSKNIVAVMSTPKEAVSGTRQYLLVCFAGIPLITAYNILSSVFRGMGDSRSPMYFILVACVCNIGLDYLFIGGLGLGPVGAALGTTLAQTISVIVAFAAIKRKKMIDGIKRSDFKPDGQIVIMLFKVGIPVSAQDGFIQISFILITIFANRRGISDAAAVGIVEKLIGILFLIPSSLLASVSALCAQNIGAGKMDRAKKTLWDAAGIAAGCGMVFAIAFQFLAPAAVGAFTKDGSVVVLGAQYMRSYVWDCVLAGMHFTFSGYFCACNHSELSFIHNIISIVTARIPIAYYASIHYKTTLFPMGMGAPIGSFISVVVCVIAYAWLEKRDKEKKNKEEVAMP